MLRTQASRSTLRRLTLLAAWLSHVRLRRQAEWSAAGPGIGGGLSGVQRASSQLCEERHGGYPHGIYTHTPQTPTARLRAWGVRGECVCIEGVPGSRAIRDHGKVANGVILTRLPSRRLYPHAPGPQGAFARHWGVRGECVCIEGVPDSQSLRLPAASTRRQASGENWWAGLSSLAMRHCLS